MSTKLRKFLNEVDYTTLNFLENLNKNSSFTFYPALEGLTKEGDNSFSKTYFSFDGVGINSPFVGSISPSPYFLFRV